MDKFAKKTKELVVGDPFNPETNIGALISEEHYKRVKEYLGMAKEDGKILVGGNIPKGTDRGYFLEPTIITDVNEESRVVQEEIFGPVVCVLPFESEENVIARANDTHYGLSATLWTNDIRRAHRVASQIEAGIVWINTWFLRDLRTPFGGMKQSGIGREGGMHSMDFFSELSNICIRL